MASYRGAGVYAYYCDPVLLNNTITLNRCRYEGPTSSGGGVHSWRYSSSIQGANNIIWGNQATSDPNYSGDVALTYSCSHPLLAGAGNIDSDPRLADPWNHDFHLVWNSPCKDSGDSSSLPPGLLDDFEGDPRLFDHAVDMGADECHPHLYSVGAVVPGGQVDVRIIAAPGSRPVRIWIGSSLLDPPKQTPFGDFFVGPPRDAFDCGSIPWPHGVKNIPVTVPSTWSSGEIHYLQAFLGDRLSNVDLMVVDQQ